MRAALDDSMLATDLADYLVRRGVPFRQAHHLVGALVKKAETQGVKLSALQHADYVEVSPLFGEDVFEVFDFDKAVARREVQGGTSPQAVREQLRLAKEVLG